YRSPARQLGPNSRQGIIYLTLSFGNILLKRKYRIIPFLQQKIAALKLSGNFHGFGSEINFAFIIINLKYQTRKTIELPGPVSGGHLRSKPGSIISTSKISPCFTTYKSSDAFGFRFNLPDNSR